MCRVDRRDLGRKHKAPSAPPRRTPATIGTTGTCVQHPLHPACRDFPHLSSTAYLAILWILFISLILATLGWFLVATKSHEPERARPPPHSDSGCIACITMLVTFVVLNFLPPTPLLYALFSSTLLSWILSNIPSALYLLTTTAYAVALLKHHSDQSGHTDYVCISGFSSAAS